MYPRIASSAALALALLAGAAVAQDTPPAPPAAPAADAPAADASPIPWEKDYEAAKAKAAKEHKGLFVYLTPEWFT